MKVHFWQDYSEWFSKKGYNWRNFTFIALYMELAMYKDIFEVHIGFMGLNVLFERGLGYETDD